MNQLQERSRKKLIISLSKIKLSDDFIVVYPANKISLDLLKLFLRVNRLMIRFVNQLAWSTNGKSSLESYKVLQDSIKQKINEMFEIVKTYEKTNKGGKQ